jgi:hypothetical protein
MSQVNITIDEFIKLIKEYDFKKNSIRKFANGYKISEKTVTKYLRENNVDYNSRTLLSRKNRDVNGRFCLIINTNKGLRLTADKSDLLRTSLDSNEISQLTLLDSNEIVEHECDSNKVRSKAVNCVYDSKKRDSFGAEKVKDNKLKTIEKIKINTPTKLAFTSETYNKQNLSDKSYEEKLRCIMTPFK